MIDHYDAFISYRHSENDIRIASRIQSDLEHFYIPSKIRKATGRKRIDRIFLDKDELGAASDLTSELSEALDNAEHLIVICSTTTKESIWVQREIEYFLRNHTRRQITTVLVDGEPEDVIPDILKYEEETVTDPDGNTRTVRVPQEPLSCDYRLPRRKAKKEELPRLASKLLECSYDELLNRRRAFMIRRMIIAVSLIIAAIIAFDAYLIYNSIQVRKNLENSLRNQSIYLAYESMDAMKNDQRILALQLALESVPRKAGDTRPITPQAVRALADSTYSYTTLEGIGIKDTWSYRMPDSMNNDNCLLSSSGKRLAAWDNTGNVRVWDTESHELLFSLDRQGNLDGIALLPDDRLLVLYPEKTSTYRLSDGACLWEKAVSVNNIPNSDLVMFPDNSILLSTKDFKLIRLDPEDGSMIASYELPPMEYETIMSISTLSLSPDNNKIAVIIFKDVASSLIYIYDIQSGTTREIDPKEYITDFIWGDTDHLIMACPADVTSYSSSFKSSTFAKTDHVKILCFDPNTSRELWHRDFNSTNVLIHSKFLLLPKAGAVAYYYANKAEIYRISDGTLIASHNTNESIILGHASGDDDWPLYVTKEGTLAFPTTADGIRMDEHFTDNLDQMIYNPDSGFFAHVFNSSEIIQYDLYVYDEGLNELKSGSHISSPEKSYIDDRVFAILSYESPDTFPGVITAPESEQLLVLTLADPSTGEQLSRIPLSENGASLSPYIISFLGSKDSHFYIGYIYEQKEYKILDIDPGTGTFTGFVLAEDETSIDWDICSFSDGKFYYCTKDHSDSRKLCIYDPDTKEISEYKISDDPNDLVINDSPKWIPQRNSVLLSAVNETILLDLSDGSIKHLEVPMDWTTAFYAYDPNRDIFAFSDRKDIRLISVDKDVDTVINCPTTPLGICFYSKEDQSFLLVPSIDGCLYRYNAETGTLLGQSDLTVPGTWDERVDFKFNDENGLLYLQLGDTLNMIETETWYEETSIQRCFGYHAPSDRFYVYSHPIETVYNVGYFSRYSVNDLIKKAGDILNGNTMPDEVKAKYGIEITGE